MSFFGSVSNALAGGALQAIGEIPGLPNRGQIKSVGDAITNPAVNMYGQANPISQAGASLLPGGQPTQNTSPSQPVVQGQTTGGGGGGSGMQSSPLYDDFINAQTNNLLAGYDSALQALPQQQSIANLGVQQAYQGNMNDLQTGRAQGNRNLDFAGNQVAEGRARSLSDLANQIRQQSMSYNNQLGAVGAGNSSAQKMINLALAQQGSRNRGDVMSNASAQEQQIGMQRQDLETEFQSVSQKLDQWKQSKIYEIGQEFAARQMEIQQQRAGAIGQRAQLLGQQNQALIQQAIDALNQTQAMYNTAAQDLVGKYQNAASPGFNIDPALGQYQVQDINAGQIAQVPGAPVSNVNFDPVSQLLKRRDDQGLVGGF